jgi:hypothetical protein
VNKHSSICLVAALLFLGQGLHAQPCNNWSVRGNWALEGTGWGIPFATTPQQPGPIVLMGVLIVDLQLRASGPATLVSGFSIPGTPIPPGTVLEMDFVDASLEVNADCAGVLRYSVKIKGFPQAVGPYLDRVIVLPDKGEMIGMTVKSPISYPIFTWRARRMTNDANPVSWPAVQ